MALHAETSEGSVENLVTGESFANKPPATARSVRRGGDGEENRRISNAECRMMKEEEETEGCELRQ